MRPWDRGGVGSCSGLEKGMEGGAFMREKREEAIEILEGLGSAARAAVNRCQLACACATSSWATLRSTARSLSPNTFSLLPAG